MTAPIGLRFWACVWFNGAAPSRRTWKCRLTIRATVAKTYGPLTVTVTAEKNAFGQLDYEVRLWIGRRARMGQGEVDAGWSVGFRGESAAEGLLNRVITIEVNPLDYTVVDGDAGLPATTGTAGVYLRLYPWRVAFVAALSYGIYWLIHTSPGWEVPPLKAPAR